MLLKYEKITKNLLDEMFSVLRNEDLEELNYYFRESAKEVFLNKIPKHNTYLLSDTVHPVAIGGIDEYDKKSAKVWLMCSEYSKSHKKELYFHIKNKMEKFFSEYEILFNFIYKSNFKVLNLLQKLCTKSRVLRIINTQNPDIKLFYFTKRGEEEIDIRYFTRE